MTDPTELIARVEARKIPTSEAFADMADVINQTFSANYAAMLFVFIAAARQDVPDLLAALKAVIAERDDWQRSQHYRYIGRDGKTWLARDLEDRAEAAEAEAATLRAQLDATLADRAQIIAERDGLLERVAELEGAVEQAAKNARYVFSEYPIAKEAVDYMEQLVYAALRAKAKEAGDE